MGTSLIEQIEFMEMSLKLTKTPMQMSILESIKELKALKEKSIPGSPVKLNNLNIADVYAIRATAFDMMTKFSGKEHFGNAEARDMVVKFKADYEMLDILFQYAYENYIQNAKSNLEQLKQLLS